jgi:hypothetical protein
MTASVAERFRLLRQDLLNHGTDDDGHALNTTRWPTRYHSSAP